MTNNNEYEEGNFINSIDYINKDLSKLKNLDIILLKNDILNIPVNIPNILFNLPNTGILFKDLVSNDMNIYNILSIKKVMIK